MKELSKETFGQTPVYFCNALVNALNKEDKPVKHKRFTFVLVAAVLIFALACTALAMGLNNSARYTAIKIARDTIMKEYGITTDTLAFFDQSVTTGDGAWTVVFSPVKFNFDAIGQYTVRVEDGKASVASWTHDGVDAAVYASGQLDAVVWGPVQLEAVLEIERAYRANQTTMNRENTGEWTLEDVAAMDQIYAEASAMGIDVWVMHVAPTAGDISQDDAYEMAKEAVVQKYGISKEALAKYDYYVEYLKYQNDEEPKYRFYMTKKHENDKQENILVSISSPSGTVNECYWLSDPEFRTLPAGSLVGYEDAVREFVEEKAFASQSVANKAEISKRIIEAGYGAYIEDRQYGIPGDMDITEQDALKVVNEAMRTTFGFTGETLAFFSHTQSFLEMDNQSVWVITYGPEQDNNWLIEWRDKLGTYEVVLAADTGEIEQITWSLQDTRGNTKYTEHTWGQSQAFDAIMLQYLMQIYNTSKPVLQKYDEMFKETLAVPDWTMEELAEYDQRFRDAGFDVNIYRHGLPDQKSIPVDEAIQIVRKALSDEFGITKTRFELAYIQTEYWIIDPIQPEWRIRCFFMDDGRQDDYGVSVNAYTGEVMSIGYIGMGNG